MSTTYVKPFTFSDFATNCYVCHSDGEAVIVDASCSTEEETSEIVDYINSNNLSVRHLLLTHAHIDHILGCNTLAKQFGLSWQAHRDTSIWLTGAPAQALLYGIRMIQPPKVNNWLDEGDIVQFGTARWNVLHTPGHAPGSICFVDEANDFVIVGDVLFNQSVGRTDLPGGNMGTLMESIFQKLFMLPDNTLVYSGHGPPTTIGAERRHNPFLV
ncbi:MAG: MBL fold metallo-hydrolase [Rhodothermaceae bacterium]|nr:MBL fold metallo-hydrolase [Rhodothermaceae bacterium]MYI84514.1 MBL fold metallo-hydrolase [Rhodothermaceae bacterium]